ncbi:hypothetical protein CAPTEDRAFT_161173 [Capitella teleta]|uniref:Helicase POLQ-like n=1 Tax=Capitella teleta TaxID=283909 RepID=R7VIV2_CAPTE|nr:hypothetical protein CAPTEDRAFT_161173 [Capitella teleta]|eukprot:ELU18559.1 hypothetical protein CAPTEDRAFT_161173 [Capitella teleta]
MAEALKEAEEIKNTKASDFVQPFGGLPVKVLELFESLRGIKELYDWQKECLCLPEVRQGKNLIYSLPTSGGKTLVAEVLIFRQLLIRKLDAILILPFVAIVQEKVRIIGAFASELDFVVEEYAAGKGQIPPRERHKRNVLYIATIEKSSALVNSLIENKRMASVGLVVVDELHMLGEGGSRGSTLETTITKVMHQSAGTQIIGMSATLNNIKDLQKFLSAQVFSNDFRPVQLKEYVKLDDGIYEVNSSALCPEDQLQLVRAISYKCSKEMKLRDPDQIVALVQEVVPQHSCLVFCPTKKNCENVAELLSCFLPRFVLDHLAPERKLLLKQLVQEGSGELCRVLRRTIPFGIAYHHSGLTADERRAIEDAYSDGVLCVLACTSTLAAGVNLPAKRVVLRSPYVADTFLSRNQYKQMVGRAGRAGIDSSGESVLILQRKDKVKLANMLIGPNEQCCSSLLYESHKGLRSLLLSTIGLKITASTQSVKAFIQRTLCFIQRSQLKVDLLQNAENALQRLHEMGLITQKTPDSLETTRLGQAVFKGKCSVEYFLYGRHPGACWVAGGVDIEFGSQLYSDLKRGLESLVLSNHLHLIFLVTPYDRLNAFTPNWNVYMDMMYSFDENELRVASMIGISEGYIVNKAACQRTRKNVNEAVVRRFYASLILYELWQQKSIWDVSRKFSVPRGQIQQLLTSAASFASCVLHFCQELEELWSYQELLAVFVKRLSYCVTAELIPLVEIPGVKIARAKQLFQGGFKTLQQIASTEPHALVNCVEHLSHKAAKQIIISAQVLLTERAEALREEAEGMEISLAEKSPHHATIVN